MMNYQSNRNYKVILFICLMIFLLLWSFYGKLIESKLSFTQPISSTVKEITVIVVFLQLTGIMLFLVYKNYSNRVNIVLFFALILTVFSFFFKTQTPSSIFFSIKFNALSLLIGMRIITVILDETGFFDMAVYKVYRIAGKSPLKILVLFSLLSYFFSLFSGSLTTMLAIAPITLSLASSIGFNPVPVIISEMICSNLGNASTMIGAIPNMIIDSEVSIHFNSFICFMMPICLILLSFLLFYMDYNRKEFGILKNNIKFLKSVKIVKPLHFEREEKAYKITIIMLLHIVILLFLSHKTFLRPAAIVLIFGFSAFLFSGLNKEKIISKIDYDEILFLIGLFIISHLWNTAGIDHYIVQGIKTLSFGKLWLTALIILWLSAAFTSIFGGNIAVVMLLPIVIGVSNNIFFWSMSLGIMCGTSLSKMENNSIKAIIDNFYIRYQFKSENKNIISFNQTSVNISLMFLIACSVYVVWLCIRS
ncbi:MAG: hypothetical protein HQK79_11315 [Desulfobacterales bacterium]|nr:hypothetical protein [Desulfobacterales bacterium]